MKQNGQIKYLNGLINGLKLKQRLYFKCMQHFHVIQSNWKNNLNFQILTEPYTLRSSLGQV